MSNGILTNTVSPNDRGLQSSLIGVAFLWGPTGSAVNEPNAQVLSARSHQRMKVSWLFRGNKLNQVVVLAKKRKVWGVELYVIGLRTADGYVILVTDHAPEGAMTEYKRRWEIEMLFSCLKNRGFDFEKTHLFESDKAWLSGQKPVPERPGVIMQPARKPHRPL